MASIKHAIEWIAKHDDPDERDYMKIAENVSVILTAAIFEKTPHEIASQVVRKRHEQPNLPFNKKKEEKK